MKKKLLGVFLVGTALFGICGCKEKSFDENIPKYNVKRVLEGYDSSALKKATDYMMNMDSLITNDGNKAYSPVSFYSAIASYSIFSEYEEDLVKDLGYENDNEVKADILKLNKALTFKDSDTYKANLVTSVSLPKWYDVKEEARANLNELSIALFTDDSKDVDEWYKKATFEMEDKLPFTIKDSITLISTYSYMHKYGTPYNKKDVTFNGKKVEGISETSNIEYIVNDDYTAVIIPSGKEKMVITMPNNDSYKYDTKEIIERSYEEGYVHLECPMFSVETKKSLNSFVQDKLGLKYLYSKPAFTKLVENDKYSIDDILQSTNFTFTNEGISGVSVTSIQAPTSDGRKPMDISIDKPFYFTLLDSANVTLFAGYVNNL